MATTYNVPLTLIPLLPGKNQSLTVSLNGTDYRLRLMFNTAPDSGWILDIGDEAGRPIVCGIPVLTQQNLLAAYEYLGIGGGGALFCSGPFPTPDPPTLEGLGVDWQLYFAPPTNAPGPLSGVAYVPPQFAGPSLT